MRPKTCLIQVPPFDSDKPAGGAEVIAVGVTRALAGIADVSILHGHDPQSSAPGEQWLPDLKARVLPAFPADDHVWRHGRIDPAFTPSARQTLDRADLLVTLERVLTGTHRRPNVACLGGLAYPHTREVVRSGEWRHLVVPSNFVREQAKRLLPSGSEITTIENGIDLDACAPSGSRTDVNRPLRLLLPSRPEPSKGLEPALDLVRTLRRQGVSVVLRFLHHADLPGVDHFAALLRTRATDVPVEALPWRAHGEMAEMYREANLTLCLARTSEGFGLTALESVACGTPVLAHPAGFLADMFPPGHGVYLLDAEASPRAAAATARQALAEGTLHCLKRGRPYAARRYDVYRMIGQYRRLAASLLSAERYSPGSWLEEHPIAATTPGQSSPGSHTTPAWDS